MAHASDLIAEDILGYLKKHEEKELLRFITCGSVDDGKSTLIGRLLHDSKMIFEDHLAAIAEDSKKVGTQGDDVDLALLVDGLQSEREQGITIDVAYRYFSTDKRKFIIADTPGHEQYTRNMATGASTCELAIILVDARKGVQTQTKRHSYICSLLGVQHVVIAINKMDLVDYDEARFHEIKADYMQMSASLNIPDIHFVPISALLGDNVVNASDNLAWYTGSTLMAYLENVQILGNTDQATKENAFRFPVQLVCRPNSDFRGFQGTVAAGSVSVGDTICILPAGTRTQVKSIETFSGEQEAAHINQAVTLTFADEVDASRGDMIVKTTEAQPVVTQQLPATLIWMHETAMSVGEAAKEYRIKFASKSTTGKVVSLKHRVDVNTLNTHAASSLALNEIGSATLALTEPVVCDAYQDNKQTGAFIIIDRMTNLTVGAGMVENTLYDVAKHTAQTRQAISSTTVAKTNTQTTLNKANTEQTTLEVGQLSDFEKELILLVRKYFVK